MKTDEVLKLIDDRDFLNKIYLYAYRRCSTSFEAEDLCSDIILAVLSAVQRQENVERFYAFVWSVARRVYADYCEKRSRQSGTLSLEDCGLSLVSQQDEIDRLIEETAAAGQLKKIFSEISFLSKAYREVMILYYIDELKVKDIASRLGISETAVKQRLFFARNTIRKEVETMNQRNISLKPVHLEFIGTGSPVGNSPSSKAERSFSQNLVYLCKEKPSSAKELSQELGVPMPYIEEELEIQCRGENGKYGLLRRLDNETYAVNIHLVDYEEYDQANRIYCGHLPEFCGILKSTLERHREKILSFPYLSPQNDLRFILWALISNTMWHFDDRINRTLAGKYFSQATPARRPYSQVAIAYKKGQGDSSFYGCDGINGSQIAGYRSVFVRNIYGARMDKHFGCGHNLSNDSALLMTVRAIGGLAADSLSEAEKEIAAKALECGYLSKSGNLLEPRIIVINRTEEKEFQNLACILTESMDELIEKTAGELAAFMKKRIPAHLIDDYQIYTKLIAGIRLTSLTIEECIKEGLLTVPESRLGAEGMLMVVEK